MITARTRFTAWSPMANRLLELPLTILLLAGMRALADRDRLREGLSWLGRHSLGLYLGQLLCMTGNVDQGLPILARSLAGFEKLGRPSEIAQTRALIERFRAGREG